MRDAVIVDAVRSPELGKMGAATVYSAESEQVGEFLLNPQVAGLQATAQVTAPAAILLASSIDGREVAGRLPARLNSGVITDAVEIGRSADGAVLATQSVFGRSYTVQSTVTIVTSGRNSVEESADPADARIVQLDLAIDPAISAEVLAEHPEPVVERPALSAASIVVSGGWGVGSAENFHVVEELADALRR